MGAVVWEQRADMGVVLCGAHNGQTWVSWCGAHSRQTWVSWGMEAEYHWNSGSIPPHPHLPLVPEFLLKKL